MATVSFLTFAPMNQQYQRYLSVVVPVMNEEDNVQPMIEAVQASVGQYDYELIFVDDGSTDQTRQRIAALLTDRIKLVELRKNYGQSTAMAAGIDHCSGQFITMLDGDLQNDPSDIPMMLEKLIQEDWDVVAGNRANRKDGALLRKLPSKIANAIIRRWTGVYIKDYGCTLKVFRAEIAQEMGLYGELHRFIPVLAAMQGAKITQVDVKHHARRFGKSKYGIGRTTRVMSDLITMVFFRKYIQRPMHLFGGLGFGSLALGILINLYLLVLKLMGHDIGGRPLLVAGMVFLLGGIQLITIGIVAEVSIRNYFEGTGRKTYNVRRIHSK